ncbi:MAG: disulfide reductase [bacterium]|nr:disulfide reductase [bacterium]
MTYLYYPGCSLKGTGKAYDESLLAVMKKLGVEQQEIDDWNCCGATAYMAVDQDRAYALASRNLALAEAQGRPNGKPVEVLTPCNACYLVLLKAQKRLEEDALGKRKLAGALESAGLNYEGKVSVRHPLDIFVNELGLDALKEKTVNPLNGLKVACYYGCQIVRPYSTFDDQYDPVAMDQVLEAMGAETLKWPLKTRCCGGSMTGTIPEVGMRLSFIILKEAKKRGADVIATACPLCQFNLECYQNEMREEFGEAVDIPVVYFSQLMGKAMGLSDRELGMQRLFVPFAVPAASK